ncbi:MAG: erythromycin esterase family protein, partial [Halobacteriaceae archaeon]
IRRNDFDFVAVEGDWVSCYELNRFVKDLSDAPGTAEEAMQSIQRWPTWMWANWEVEAFLEWLRVYNRSGAEVGFYGMDVYGLHESMEAVVNYLESVDPEAADYAKEAYRCFEPYGADAQEYARALRMVPESCEGAVIDVLSELRESAPTFDTEHQDDYFNAEQNALVAKNAERYYRALASGTSDSWNIRDEHMTDTIERLVDHHGEDASAIIWAHNTHVGDARATNMEDRGRLNIGQLHRERFGEDDVSLVGFGTYEGDVIASKEWGASLETMPLPVAQEGSLEHAFHRADGDRLLFASDLDANGVLADRRGHRAIGVVYHPQMERGNYVPTSLPRRYDAFIHIDETNALHPIDVHPEGERVPELYPSGV